MSELERNYSEAMEALEDRWDSWHYDHHITAIRAYVAELKRQLKTKDEIIKACHKGHEMIVKEIEGE